MKTKMIIEENGLVCIVKIHGKIDDEGKLVISGRYRIVNLEPYINCLKIE